MNLMGVTYGSIKWLLRYKDYNLRRLGGAISFFNVGGVVKWLVGGVWLHS